MNNSILEGLNEQQKAVCISDNNIILTACPGSGKTRTITHRLAYVQEKYSPSRKLNIAITYTNRAADEISSRIEKMGISCDTVWTGTIHQFCMHFIIRPYSMYSDRLSKGYHIIDEFISNKYLLEIANSLGLSLNYYDNPRNYPNVVTEYHNFLKQKKEIDFDLILELSYDLLSNHKFISENISSIFRSIHVDEYQDTNNYQYLILAEIFKSNKQINMVFVGDVNQAIYGNLGGVAKNKEEIEQLFEVPFENKNLSGCYRSTQSIVDYYVNFEIENTSVFSVAQYKNTKGALVYNKSISKTELPNKIAEIITQCLKIGISEDEICVISPQWYNLYNISNALKKMLPNVNFDAPDVSPFKYDPMNPFYILARLVFTDSGRHIELRKRLANEFLEILESEYKIYIPTNYDCHILLKNINYLTSSVDEEDGLTIYFEVVKRVLLSLGVDIKKETELNSIYELYNEKTRGRIEQYSISQKYKDIKYYFKEKKGVVINTIHGVKGEEFTTVIAFGLLNGYLPHWNYITQDNLKPHRENEANKLLYVLTSRAKVNLYLFSETGRTTKKGIPLTPTDELIRIENIE